MELHGEPVEQFRMRGESALGAEVLGRLHEADTEVKLPGAIDRDAGCERIRGIDEPPREPQSVTHGFLR